MAPIVSNVDNDNLRVLITGFGPFGNVPNNPSWLAAKPLHGEILHTDPSLGNQGSSRKIHCSSMLVPVTYKAVLDSIPGLHARPPRLPETRQRDEEDLPVIPPPEKGYDFIFHVGVAGRGALRIEKLGHKLGYRLKDANGDLASIVEDDESTKIPSRVNAAPSEAETLERSRLGAEVTGRDRAVSASKLERGFGAGYSPFAEELHTALHVDELCRFVRHIDPVYEKSYASSDAGHYLCDFIYYCSLAEALRTAGPPLPPYAPVPPNKLDTRVLFLHIPPENQPHSIAEVTEAIRRIIVWVLSTT